ncbi:hypothetical protein [Calothrix anomala]|uniref:hypothetical protein n=1 Tax=Calothrix anomala TaxID=212351 RepID=UPI001A7EC768|nr:hypothetical protein [Calothrix anomala]
MTNNISQQVPTSAFSGSIGDVSRYYSIFSRRLWNCDRLPDTYKNGRLLLTPSSLQFRQNIVRQSIALLKQLNTEVNYVSYVSFLG